MNRAILIGRLGHDPELRRGERHTVCRFSLATDRPGHDDPDWHKVVCWDALAENVAKFMGKGRLVCVEGQLRTNRWEDEHGVRRATTEVHAARVHFLDGPKADDKPRRDPRTHGPGGHRRAFEGGQKR